MIYFCDAQLYFQHHYSSLQCHMIFRNQSNMMICCLRSPSTGAASVSRLNGTLTGQLFTLAGNLQAEAAVSAAQTEFEGSAVSGTEVRQNTADARLRPGTTSNKPTHPSRRTCSIPERDTHVTFTLQLFRWGLSKTCDTQTKNTKILNLAFKT